MWATGSLTEFAGRVWKGAREIGTMRAIHPPIDWRFFVARVSA